uniref:Uncharacterized protein n=1 Tax=Oryza rufipogon TaxID=4529 RepID=A0A0E0RF45_ORYRU
MKGPKRSCWHCAGMFVCQLKLAIPDRVKPDEEAKRSSKRCASKFMRLCELELLIPYIMCFIIIVI